MRNSLITLAMTASLALAGAGLAAAGNSQPLNQRCAEARTAYYQLIANYPQFRPYLEPTRQAVNAQCGAGYIPAA